MGTLLLLLVVAAAGLVVAERLANRLDRLRARLEMQEAHLAELEARLAAGAQASRPPAGAEAPGQVPEPPVLLPSPPAPAPTPPAAGPAVPPAVGPAAPPAAPPAAAPEPAITERRPPAPAPGAPPPSAPRRPGPIDLEAQLGGRLSVWIGAVALALAGAFLVKYTFDIGLLNPTVRVTLGVLSGVVALGVGAWTRRSSAAVAAGLTAAGIADLFASFWAATSAFHLVLPATGFALMALTTATAVALSLRHGPIIATIGLVGGFLTPYLVRSGASPNPVTLFGYLLLLQLGLFAVTSRRGWWPLAALTLAAGMGWVVLWLDDSRGPFVPGHAATLEAFLLTSVAAFVVAGGRSASDKAWGGLKEAPLLGWIAATAALVLTGVVLAEAGSRPQDWAFVALFGAGAFALGMLDPSYERLPWLAAAITSLLLATWPAAGQAREFYAIAGLLGALYAVGGYGALWIAPRPAGWAALAGAASLGAFAIAFAFGPEPSPPAVLPWGAVALGLGALAVAAATPVARRRATLPEGPLVLAALAATATAFLALAVTLELEREWIGVAWALEGAALAWIAHRLDVPVLRRIVWPLAALVALRLLANPFVLTYPIGPWPLVNWLAYGYGVPIAAFVGAAWLALQDGDDRLSRALQWLALALGLALVTLEVRQVFHPGDLAAFEIDGTVEWASYGIAWLASALVVLLAAERWPVAALRRAGPLLVGLGLAEIALLPVLIANPLWSSASVGATPILNWLPYIYGLPALLAAGSARLLRRRADVPAAAVGTVEAAAIGLVFVLVTLEVRQLFHGADLRGLEVATTVEWATYGIAWLALALVLLVAAERWPLETLRGAGPLLVGLGLVEVVGLPVLLANPVWSTGAVGATPILNWLPYIYGLPAVLALGCARLLRRRADVHSTAVRAVQAAAIGLVFVLVTLEVRQLFHGADLGGPVASKAELYGYSLAWVLFGTVLLVLGIARRDLLVRYASLAVMLLTVGKVFLFDTANLGDLYRVLSFLGLGLSLLLLGWLYQRFVFAPRPS